MKYLTFILLFLSISSFAQILNEKYITLTEVNGNLTSQSDLISVSNEKTLGLNAKFKVIDINQDEVTVKITKPGKSRGGETTRSEIYNLDKDIFLEGRAQISKSFFYYLGGDTRIKMKRQKDRNDRKNNSG